MRRAVLAVLCFFLTTGFGWEGRVARLTRELGTAEPARRAEVVHLLGAYGERGADGILIALDDTDVDVRVEAAQVAGAAHIRAASTRLVSYLDEPEPALREASVAALGGLGDAHTAPAVVRVLGDANARVRRAAVVALVALATSPRDAGTAPVEAVVPLLARLDDDDPSVRAEAADGLARLGDPRGVVPLVGKARDATPEVRGAVYAALGALGDRRALSPLLSGLDDDDPDARLAAVAALGRLGDPDAAGALVEQLGRGDVRLARAATAALAALPGDRALDAVVEQLAAEPLGARPGATPTGQALLARARAATDVRVRLDIVRAVVRALEAGASPRVAGILAELAELVPTTDALPSLVRVYTGAGGREPAGADCLGALAAGRAVPDAACFVAIALARAQVASDEHDADTPPAALVALLGALDSHDVQREGPALAGLEAYFASHAPDGRAADPLVAALARVQPSRRAKVVDVLGTVRAVRALPVLRPLLVSTGDPELRRATVRALGAIGDAGAAPMLLPLLEDPSPETRVLAARALAGSASPETVHALLGLYARDAPTDRHAVLLALGPALARLRDALPASDRTRARETLLAAARSPDATLAARALDAAVLSGDPELAAPLAEVVRGAAPTTRLAALRALGLVRGGATSPVLARAMRDTDPDARAAALGVLGEHGDAAMVTPLLDAAGAADGPASSSAAFSLARLARRGVLGRASAPRLCTLLAAREPFVRANVMVALAALGARCEQGPAPEDFLGPAHAEAVREAAAHWAGAAPTEASAAALSRCATSDTSDRVANACASPSLPPLEALADVTSWDAAGAEPLARALVALRFADGSALVARTDADAHLLLPDAPRGTLALDDPLDVPLDPR